MDSQNDDAFLEPRTPKVSDLVSLCLELNKRQAKYIVIGGMAIVQWGNTRLTEDIDLLIETSQENQQKVFEALRTLPDKAVNEVRPTDMVEYQVVKVADEFIVDLMAKACGISYEEAKGSIKIIVVEGVEIPVPSVEMLWRMKQTMREKDKLDLMFLKELLNKK